MNIPQIEPWTGEEELAAVTEVIRSNWVTEGPKTELFEQKFRSLVGAAHALAVCNGTIGLYMCLRAVGVGPGDLVAVPDLTFIATVNSVILAGAEPVLVDIDPDTFNMDPADLEAKISPRTKAVMPVHLYGQAANMGAINQITQKHGLWVVEDAAQGVGVKFCGQHVGIWGHAGVFSFYGNKTITTGEGGMITTNDPEIAMRCWALKNHGRTRKGTFVHDSIGFNFSFTDLQAALGLAQLAKLDGILERKRRNWRLYREGLREIEQVEFPQVDPRCEYVPWFTSVLVEDPQAVADYLAGCGIGTRRFFYPMHRQPCYTGRFGGPFPNADRAYARGLSLPSAATLREEQVEFVCQKIAHFYREQR